MQLIHGGDIYRNQIKLDFSVNINPLGIPQSVQQALHKAVDVCSQYPDMKAEKLTQTVSAMLAVPQEYLLFGNGASELFMAIVHALSPQKTILPVPSFYGYEYALQAACKEVIYYPMREEVNFGLTDIFLEHLTEDIDLIFIANPNNPTGKLLDRIYLKRLLNHCRDKGIVVVLDECFVEFCGSEASVLSEIGEYENLILVRAFTKLFAIPGVRLGYLVCSNALLVEKIRRQLPEWNLSVFAQEAGCACAGGQGFVEQTVEYVRKERLFLADGLKEMGLRVFPGDANFLMVYSEKALYEPLLKQGILIRDCRNFRGLCEGYYRIAVRSREDNEQLMKAIGVLE